jgi:hypothetical protein
VSALLFAVAMCTAAAMAQRSPDDTVIHGERAWRVTHVYVRLQVQNVTQKPRFIRVCGEQDGENYLCALATHVEVRSHRS